VAYTVKPGDTLSAIARRNNTSVSELLRLNPKFATDAKYQGGKVIFSGTKVNLPAAPKTTTTPTPTPLPLTPTVTPVVTSSVPARIVDQMRGAVQPVAPVVSPSALAAQESGAIGAASIAAQMQATPAPVATVDTRTALQKLQSGQPLTDEEKRSLNLPVDTPPPPPAPSITPPEEKVDETLDKKVDETPDKKADQTGTSIKDKQMPGGTEDAAALLEAQREKADAEAKAQAERALTLRTLQAEFEPQIRGTERNIYTSQMRALADLARRGFTGQTGLAKASQRAYAVAPLQARIDTLGKMLKAQQAAGALLPEQLVKAQRDYERALGTSRKSIGINNKLGGRNG
jgi:hypothetical protein